MVPDKGGAGGRMMTMKEGSITKAILAYLNSHPEGFAVKVHAGANQGRGVPDVVGVVSGHSLWLEVKTRTGRATPIQEHRIKQLQSAGAIASIVRSVEDVIGLLEARGIECS